jgi:hypothetical protein
MRAKKLNPIYLEVLKAAHWDPMGVIREMADKIFALKRPRDFEKLKLTDEQCVNMLGQIQNTEVDAARIRPLVQQIPNLPAKKGTSKFI